MNRTAIMESVEAKHLKPAAEIPTLRIGDTVLVEKGGEIIPKITGVVPELRPQGAQPVQFPTECPACGTSLVRPDGEAHFRCPNASGCGPQLQTRLEHFVSRKAMDINGLGEGKLAVLIEHGLVRNPADFYDLKHEQLVGLTRVIEDPETGAIKRISFGERTAQIILDGIQDTRLVPYERVIFALGIRQVGEGGAKRLAKALPSMRKLLAATREELAAIPDIGGITADSIFTWCRDAENIDILSRLQAAGLNFEADVVEAPVALGSSLAGKTFLLSGVFSQPREDLHKLIEAHGGTLSSGISKKLSFLVAGEKMGPAKREKAQKEKVQIIDEQTLLQLINS